jgi:GNAT superfamily N-acetyltransferase
MKGVQMNNNNTFAGKVALVTAAMGEDIGLVASAHLDRAFRQILRGPMVVAERRFVRLITGEAHPLGNLAIVSDPADPQGAQAAIEPSRACGAPAMALFPGPVVLAVTDVLARTGFESHGAMPAMAGEIASLSTTSLPHGYALSRIGSGTDSEAWTEAFAAGYGLPRGVAEAFSPNAVRATTSADAALQYFAIRKGDRIVCTSLICLADEVAGVYCVATIPEERGKGFGAHATAEPLRLLGELGYRVGVLQSSDEGQSMYEKLGFADVGAVSMYIRA